MTDKGTGLMVLRLVIISNQTIHQRKIALSCNVMPIDFIKDILPGLKKVHFWSDDCLQPI